MSRPTTLTAHTLPVSWSPVSLPAGHCVSLQFTIRTLWVCVCRNGCQLGQMWFRQRRPSTRTLQEPWRPCPSWACPSCWSAWAARALKRSVLSSPLLIAHATWAGAECTQLPELQFGLPLATAACYCCLLLLLATAASYCCLLLLLATAACCCCLLLLLLAPEAVLPCNGCVCMGRPLWNSLGVSAWAGLPETHTSMLSLPSQQGCLGVRVLLSLLLMALPLLLM